MLRNGPWVGELIRQFHDKEWPLGGGNLSVSFMIRNGPWVGELICQFHDKKWPLGEGGRGGSFILTNIMWYSSFQMIPWLGKWRWEIINTTSPLVSQ